MVSYLIDNSLSNPLYIMGNKRRRKEKKRKRDDSDTAAICSGGDTKDTTASNISVDIETDNNTITSPPIWTAEFVENIQKNIPTNEEIIPSLNDIGLQIVRGTLEKISSKKYKKAQKNNKSNETSLSVNATPIQLRLWPALLTSFQSTSQMNVIGIAPTGSGKTQSYSIPIISQCVHTLLQSTKQQRSTNVHGLVLVPTRELAIQVAKELHLAAKVANKYMSKCCTKLSLNVDSLAIYGGADIDTQINTLLGKDDDSSDQTNSLVVAATAGRLLDILKQTEKNVAEIAFSNLQAIVYDEADRIAINVDMANQVDEILSILKSVRTKPSADIVSCLVSATLPDKAKEVCERWVPRTRIVIKVNSVKVGDKKHVTEQQLNTETTKTSKDHEDVTGSDTETKIPQAEEQGKKKRNIPSSLDLSSIPSNIVQTLHVCSAHKKPKKLILTLQRIYMKKDEKSRSERFSANNRLTIVFFGQIKTVKYMSKLLVKEGLRCVELYGSLQQADREKRLLEFKAGEILYYYVLYEKNELLNSISYLSSCT